MEKENKRKENHHLTSHAKIGPHITLSLIGPYPYHFHKLILLFLNTHAHTQTHTHTQFSTYFLDFPFGKM